MWRTFRIENQVERGNLQLAIDTFESNLEYTSVRVVVLSGSSRKLLFRSPLKIFRNWNRKFWSNGSDWSWLPAFVHNMNSLSSPPIVSLLSAYLSVCLSVVMTFYSRDRSASKLSNGVHQISPGWTGQQCALNCSNYSLLYRHCMANGNIKTIFENYVVNNKIVATAHALLGSLTSFLWFR